MVIQEYRIDAPPPALAGSTSLRPPAHTFGAQNHHFTHRFNILIKTVQENAILRTVLCGSKILYYPIISSALCTENSAVSAVFCTKNCAVFAVFCTKNSAKAVFLRPGTRILLCGGNVLNLRR